MLPMKTLNSIGHEKGKPMKYLWKGAKYNQWNYHERPMKLMAWTRSMKKPWNLFPSNETYEKAVKIIAVQPALLKSHENCYPPTTLWKSHENVHTWKSHENTMKLQRPLPKGFKIDNTTVGSTDKSSQLLSFIPWGNFLFTIVVSPNLFRPSSLLLGACPWYDVLASHCMHVVHCVWSRN